MILKSIQRASASQVHNIFPVVDQASESATPKELIFVLVGAAGIHRAALPYANISVANNRLRAHPRV
jgi:hypothetical protein